MKPVRDNTLLRALAPGALVPVRKLFVLLAVFSIPALADSVQSHVPKGASRKLSARTVTAGFTTQPQSVSGNICADMNGPIDTRPGTYGTAEAVEVPLVFAPPAGYAVYIDRIMGDLVAWPVAGSATNVPPAGVLAGVQLIAPPDAPTCDLCAANTPLYVQSNVPPTGSTRVFDYPIGQRLSDSTLTVVLASWLNLYTVPVHAEITYTIQFHLVAQ